MFDLHQLEVFCRVLELKSFSKAAESVYLTQPTVSGHIQALEQFLDTRLFDRLGKEVVPTRAGELLYKYARQMLSLRSEARRELELFLGRVKGEMTIGASTIPGAYILPELIGSFKKEHSDIYITLTIADTTGVIESLLAGKIEIGVVGAKIEDKRLQYREWVRDEMVIVVPSGYKWAGRRYVEADELKKEAFMLREPGSGTRMTSLKALEKLGMDAKELNIIAEMGSTEAVRQAVKAGIGISILSRRAVKDDIAAGSLHGLRVKGLDLWREFYVVVLKGRTLSPITDSFLDFLFLRATGFTGEEIPA
ncbi:MAG: selenium metabolism-associated LysR family transcriptional regulator [Desulfovibrionales bacterium]|nr:selenium metabolism-associated LysR family transcriptional regulator [Desulfovibrionales bacterium]